MKAAVLEKVRKIVIKDIDKPRVKAGHVLIKIDYVGICGSDVHYYEHGRIGDFVVEKPIILGHECSGTVEELGDGVANFKIGDKVVPEPGFACNKCDYCKMGSYNLCEKMTFMATPPVDGAFCEYISYPADMVFKLPENVTAVEGALIEPLAIGVYAAQTGGIFPGAKVLVLGAGCIGLVSMLAVKAYGASLVIVTDILNNRLEAAEKLGADYTINTTKNNLHELLADITGDNGVDVVIDCVGISATINDGINSCAKGGAIVVVGMGSDGNVSINMNRAISKEISLKTIFRYKNIFPTALKLVADGKIDIKGIVSHSYDFEEIEKAMEFVSNNKQNVVKAIVKMRTK